MTHVVAEPCFDCKYTDCVVVCPVDCFYQSDQLLYIHPEECIDCEACVPECPVEAIFHEDNLPEQWKEYTALNAEMARQSPNIAEKQDPLEGEQCVGKEARTDRRRRTGGSGLRWGKVGHRANLLDACCAVRRRPCRERWGRRRLPSIVERGHGPAIMTQEACGREPLWWEYRPGWL